MLTIPMQALSSKMHACARPESHNGVAAIDRLIITEERAADHFSLP
jgi:hypothetical protein